MRIEKLREKKGDSFSQFRFVEEKEWDGEVSGPKQNSAFYVDCESLVRALQELPLSLRLNVAAELVQILFIHERHREGQRHSQREKQASCGEPDVGLSSRTPGSRPEPKTALPLELPQMKPKRNDEAKGLGMQLKGPLGPGGKGSVSELKPAACCPAPSGGPQKPTAPLPSAADHLEEELDLLLSLDAPVRDGESILPDLTPGLESEKDRDMAQEGQGPAEPSVTDEKNVQSEQPSTSKPVTEEELEDWLDSMIS
ncbi:cell death regulator Aven [Canis lupus baileyi]|uniref:cell death regulator Aven n=1 Tax=Canis lupus baileyi TaxID=143281 RepID=UPI003B96CCD2